MANPIRIVPASDKHGIESTGYYVETPHGRWYRESLETARVTAKLQAEAHGTTVDESAIEGRGR